MAWLERTVALASSAALSFSLAACSCDPPPRPPLDAALPDAPRDTSGPMIDAPLEDGEVRDTGVPEDAPLADGDAPEITCTFDPVMDVIELARDPIDASRIVGVDGAGSEWGLTWTQSLGGFQNVWWVHMGITGFATAVQVTETTAFQQQPTIAATDSGWVVAWYGNVDGDFEIYSRAYSRAGDPMGAVSNRVTSRLMRDDNPMLLGFGPNALLAFSENEGTMTRLAVTRMLGANGAPMGAPITVTAASATVPQPILGERAGGALLGWVDSAMATPSAMLMPLDASGASAGPAALLSTEMNADGTLDLATDAIFGGAAVFGVAVAGIRSEVRARRVAADGSVAGMPEVVLTPAPEEARDASIARFAGGYAVSYRAITGTTAVIRLALFDATLVRAATFDLVAAAPTGGRTTVRVNDEGRILVAWADVPDSTHTDIRAVRILCE